MKRIKVNPKLIPVKLHYFFYFGAQAGVLPFVSVIAGQLGISATAVGIILTVLPFITLTAKPLFGGLADHLQKLKLILLIFIVISPVSFLGIHFIPGIYSTKDETKVNILIYCNPQSQNFRSSKLYNVSCISEKLQNNSEFCALFCETCKSVMWHDNIKNGTVQNSSSCDESYKTKEFYTDYLNTSNTITEVEDVWKTLHSYPTCLTKQTFNCEMKCNTSLENCLNANEELKGSIYDTFQFWLFFLFVTFAWVSSGVITSLSDAACYEMLEGKNELYGKQRLWGTIGWGIFSLFTGYLNDIITGNAPIKNYSASFYMLAGLMLFDFIIVARSNIKNAKLGKTPLKNVCILFTQMRIVVFIITVFFIGAFTGLHWAYFFWYMNDLKADQLMMGLALGIESFVGEIPFFFFAGMIIEKFGHVNTINLTLFCFAIRYILYSFIKNPWLVLPVELLQGPTFGIFYATMTSYAKSVAPAGTEAMMQGILGGVFEGLGIAIGSLLGGLSTDNFGTHQTFRIAGYIALACCIIHMLFNIILLCRKQSDVKNREQGDRKSVENESFI